MDADGAAAGRVGGVQQHLDVDRAILRQHQRGVRRQLVDLRAAHLRPACRASSTKAVQGEAPCPRACGRPTTRCVFRDSWPVNTRVSPSASPIVADKGWSTAPSPATLTLPTRPVRIARSVAVERDTWAAAGSGTDGGEQRAPVHLGAMDECLGHAGERLGPARRSRTRLPTVYPGRPAVGVDAVLDAAGQHRVRADLHERAGGPCDTTRTACSAGGSRRLRTWVTIQRDAVHGPPVTVE